MDRFQCSQMKILKYLNVCLDIEYWCILGETCITINEIFIY